MGNLCSKQTLHLTPQKFPSFSTSCSLNSIEADHDFELHYTPATGEGESLKVLFSFLGVPLKEVIHSDQQLKNTVLYCNNSAQTGTFESLKYVSQIFEIYPQGIKDAYVTDLLCEMVFAVWRSVKDAFYQNDRCAINNFYRIQIPTLLKILEKYAPNNCEHALVGHAFGICDVIVLTFVYNLFFIQDTFRDVLTQYAPRLEQYCLRLLQTYEALGKYFKTRKFHLYI